jgi:hypothetical protein
MQLKPELQSGPLSADGAPLSIEGGNTQNPLLHFPTPAPHAVPSAEFVSVSTQDDDPSPHVITPT